MFTGSVQWKQYMYMYSGLLDIMSQKGQIEYLLVLKDVRPLYKCDSIV